MNPASFPLIIIITVMTYQQQNMKSEARSVNVPSIPSIPLDLDPLPQVVCLDNGECTFTDFIADHQIPEVTTSWYQQYGINNPEEDTWFELVGQRLPGLPTPPYTIQTATPVTNIVRIPNRRVSWPVRQQHPLLATTVQTLQPLQSSASTVLLRPSTTTRRPSAVPVRQEEDRVTIRPAQVSSASSPLINNVVVFKMLLLIAFVAVPIVAAAMPLILPTGHLTRSRREDAIVQWATHSATLIALSHLANDDRLPQLLKLHDEAFVEALSMAVVSPMKEAGDDSRDIRERKEEVSDAVLKLLETVKSWDDFSDVSSETSSEENEVEL